MQNRSFLWLAVACVIVSGAALAADRYPGMADLMAPGGTFPGTPDYGKAGVPATAQSRRCFADFDGNGDGALEPAELDPSSQLAKRFGTRDANHDGKLTRDEYAFAC
ncbi:hypothetical protein AAG565_05395 [Fontimonas sp. SYSU GA230001]|uniref:hypothetical protein n=1 Tax=Fontimonas sp. SYSU GA230001 TaxID=3142450 RepID=UPI0032B33A14